MRTTPFLLLSLIAGCGGDAPTACTATLASGSHTLVLKPTGASGSVPQSITSTTGVLNTIAAVRASNGSVATAVLDDTGSVVPSGATKVRVLHLAPNAGELQVVIPLKSGEKKTIVILDKPGGGVRIELF